MRFVGVMNKATQETYFASFEQRRRRRSVPWWSSDALSRVIAAAGQIEAPVPVEERAPPPAPPRRPSFNGYRLGGPSADAPESKRALYDMLAEAARNTAKLKRPE